MIIEHIEITDFGRLHQYACDFGQGLNIIEGPNESGKSTLAAFIRYMLYGFPGRATGNQLGEKKKRISWEGGRAAGSMTVRVGEKRYRLERSTVAVGGGRERETYRETAAIIDLETGTPLLGTEAPGERFLGVPEEVYGNTAFVSQIGSPRVGAQEMNAAIENLLFAGDENVNVKRALDKLDSLRRSLLYKNNKGGEIFDLTVKEEELASRLEAAQRGNAALLEDEALLQRKEKELQEATVELQEAERRQRLEECATVVAAYDCMHKAERDLAQAETELKKLDGLPAIRLEESDLRELRGTRGTAEEAERRYTAAREHRIRLETEVPNEPDRPYLEQAEKLGGPAVLHARFTSATRRRTGCLIASGVGAGLALLCLLAALLFPALRPLCIAGTVLFAVVAGACLGISLYTRRALAALAAVYGSTAEGFAERLQQIEACGERQAEWEREKGRSVENEREAFEAYNARLSELDTIVRRFETRLPQDDIWPFLDELERAVDAVMKKKQQYEQTRLSSNEVIATLRQSLAGKMGEEDARAGLPDQYEIHTEALNPDKTQTQVRFYRQKKEMLEGSVREIERRVLKARGLEDPVTLAAEYEQTVERREAAEAQHRACCTAYDAIDGAGEQLRRQVSPRLSQYARQLVERWTEGRYARIGVGADLTLTVGDETATHALDYFSAGTQDLTYLALRMALIDLLYAEKPPVCFDESFAHQDDARAARMLEVLEVLSRNGLQMLLFTCHGREHRLAEEKVPGACILTMEA